MFEVWFWRMNLGKGGSRFGIVRFISITKWKVQTTLAHFLGFEFLVRNEENILLSHEKRGTRKI